MLSQLEAMPTGLQPPQQNSMPGHPSGATLASMSLDEAIEQASSTYVATFLAMATPLCTVWQAVDIAASIPPSTSLLGLGGLAAECHARSQAGLMLLDMVSVANCQHVHCLFVLSVSTQLDATP